LEERLGVSAVHATVVAGSQKHDVRFLEGNVVGDEFRDAWGRICLDNIVID
jgi:hypothetical protein